MVKVFTCVRGSWLDDRKREPGLRSSPSPGALLLRWEGQLGHGRLRGSPAGDEDVYEGLGFEPLSVESSPDSRVDAQIKLACRGEEAGAGVSAPEGIGL